jgi:hypothetical protein
MGAIVRLKAIPPVYEKSLLSGRIRPDFGFWPNFAADRSIHPARLSAAGQCATSNTGGAKRNIPSEKRRELV